MSEKERIQPVSESLQHQFEELKERASKDALSGLLNRTTAEMYISRRLEKMEPGEHCALFIIDMDNFKQVNDTLGHQAGDQAIRQSARILSGLFRANDIVGRLGGDEFIVFISGTVTEKLIHRKGKEICEQLQLVLGSSPGVLLTASVGIHFGSGTGCHFDSMYQSADMALYKAKRSGKHGYFVRYAENFADSDSESESVLLPVSTISLNGLLEYMESGIALLEAGETMRLIYVSPGFCRMIGADPATYKPPKLLSDIIHPDDWVGLSTVLRESLRDGREADHIHRVSSDGKNWIWWHIRAAKIEYSSLYPVMLVTATDVSRFKENEKRLKETNERLQSAFEQTAGKMWEVDISSGKITVFGCVSRNGQKKDIEGDFPDFPVSSGWIHPDSVSRFQSFAGELLSGKTRGYGNFVLQYPDTGCYGWAALSYRLLYDEVGRPVRAVGIIEKLPVEFAGRESEIFSKRFFPESLMADLIVKIQANLTRDSVRELWIEGKNFGSQAAEESCTQILQQEKKKIFRSDDRQILDGYFDRRQLLKYFEQNERWMTLEYRRTDGSGKIRWITHMISLVRDPLTQDVYMFAYLNESDLQHRRETETGADITRDPVTGLYDRASAQAVIESQLRKGGFHEYAVAVIQINGLERLCSEDGADAKRRRRDLASALSAALGPSCITGQYSRDRILVFFPDIRSRADVKHRIEESFSFVRSVLSEIPDLESLRFVAGAACAGTDDAGYISMISRLVRLCQLWQNAPSDTVAFPNGDDDWEWSELQQKGEEDWITTGQGEMSRPLSEEEKDIAFQCVSTMLSSDSPDSSIHSVLNYIGTYYCADRAYILMLAENRHVITMPYEWRGSGKSSIQQAVSGLFMERFPLLGRCMEENAPIFLTKLRPFGQKQREDSGNYWRFIVFPMTEENTTTGFLCIENPREHPADAALLSVLIPHILKEQRRFHTHMKVTGDTSKIFPGQMPNLRSYMNVIYSLNSDVYSSMGAVCLDIPQLSAINSIRGFEYGSRLLWYVSKTMSDIFGSSFIFRTWDAEFVALCPDNTRQVFAGKCTRLRSILQRRYPKSFRIGYTWSEKVFSGKTLVNEARTIMRCEHVENTGAADTAASSASLQNADESILPEEFSVYLQPKIDMSTGMLLGAEALVRGIDESGNVIPPIRFIKKMEQNGSIRELDLRVLDRTLALMESWSEKGLKLVPVSVNFSRITLFDPSALASVLAVQSRYPRLPSGFLELEITERGGNVESGALSEVIDRFRESGIRFALDDFGSEYANISAFTNVKFDCVKLDRSLIAQLADNSRGRMLVHDLVKICHSSGMDCVAEGVETEAQISALSEAGCVCAQGYYFDRPMPAEQFEEKYLRPVRRS